LLYLLDDHDSWQESLTVKPTGLEYYNGDDNVTNGISLTNGLVVTGDIATVTADGFIKNGSSNDYVLLAGGGTKALSEFSSGGGSSSVDWSNVQNKPTNVSAFTNDAGYLTSHQSLAGYLPLTGGTLTGPLTTSGTTQGIQLRARFENDAVAIQKFENNDWVDVCSMSGTGYVTGSTYHGNQYIVNNGTSDQFLKADGSVDSNSYLPLTGGQMTGDLTLYNSNAQVVNVSGKTSDTTSLGGGSITIETATTGTPLKAKSYLDHD